LPEESILTDEFLRQLINVGEADILVGVPTYNNAATVGQVVQTVRAGLLKYFPRERAVIVNADGGSRDQTPDLVRGASINDAQVSSDIHALRTLHCISAEYPGEPATSTAPLTCCVPPPARSSRPNPPPLNRTGSSACCALSTRESSIS
jgi:glucosylglycerate synthase